MDVSGFGCADEGGKDTPAVLVERTGQIQSPVGLTSFLAPAAARSWSQLALSDQGSSVLGRKLNDRCQHDPLRLANKHEQQFILCKGQVGMLVQIKHMDQSMASICYYTRRHIIDILHAASVFVPMTSQEQITGRHSAKALVLPSRGALNPKPLLSAPECSA